MKQVAALVFLALCLALPAAAADAAADAGADLVGPHYLRLDDGRRINFHCEGQGTPAVVFDSGGEGSVLSWRKVFGAVAARTRACVYDRPGMGYSDPPTKPVTAVSVTDDLREILAKAGVKGPVVIVGHSIGGFYATVYADRFPAGIAGLVLLDPGFSGQVDPRPPESLAVDREHIRAGEARLLDCAALARAGGLSLADAKGCMSYPPPQAPEEVAYLGYILGHPFWYETEYAQSRRFFLPEAGDGPSEDTLEERRLSRPFGDLPMIVLSASDPPTRAWNTAAEQRAQVEDWQAGHRRLAQRSRIGRWRIVPGSGHYVALDQPDTVIAAIDEVLARARGTGP
ncbi:MAG TPA: alpha/beta hydrolase [Caulobacteraceae bacterium]|nr:alpha/beta hydrolase [Caulobacteraceae bacterium]